MKRQNKQCLYHPVSEIIFMGCFLLFFFPKICQSSPTSLTIVINPQSINFAIDGPPQKYFGRLKVGNPVTQPTEFLALLCQNKVGFFIKVKKRKSRGRCGQSK